MNLRKDHYRLCLSAPFPGFGSARVAPRMPRAGGEERGLGRQPNPPVQSALPAVLPSVSRLGLPFVPPSPARAAVVAAGCPLRGRVGGSAKALKSGPSPDRTGLPPFFPHPTPPTGRHTSQACSLVPGADGDAGCLRGSPPGGAWGCLAGNLRLSGAPGSVRLSEP